MIGFFRAACIVCLVAFLGTPSWAGFDDRDQEREQRWNDLKITAFGGRAVLVDEGAIQLNVPDRALDASLVPVEISIAHLLDAKSLYLFIDDNPSPLAAHFTFGRASDPSIIRIRVRVDTYTNVHAVVETMDGHLFLATRFVKASGGCSAPIGASDEEAILGIGEMKMKIGDFTAQNPSTATLMVRHPNFNGMQMNQETRAYTPARFIQTLSVRFNDVKVFDLASDISLASNPVITFGVRPNAAHGIFQVDVTDSQNDKWSKTFDVPFANN